MKAFGIVLGGSAVEAAELAGSSRSLRLVRAARAEVVQDADRGDVLKQALEASGIRPAKACVAIPAEGAVVRRMTVPVRGQGALARAVRFQAEDLLCDASLEDVVVEHQVLGPSGDSGTEVLVMVARKSHIARALADSRAAGFEPSSITLDAAALLAAANASGALPAAGVAAIVDVEGTLTRILLVRDGKAAAFRATRRADSDAAADAAASELARTLAGEGFACTPAAVLAYGDDAAGVAKAVFAKTGAEAVAPDASGLLLVEGGGVSIVAAGAALIAAGAGPLHANFMKGEFAPTGEARKLRTRVAFAAVALAALFAVLLASSWRRWAAADRYLDQLTAEEQKIWKSVFPNKSFPRVGFDRYITDPKLKEARKGSEETRYASFLDALTRSAQSLPGSGVEVSSMSFDQQKMVITGEVDSMERFDSLVSSLEARFGVRVKPQMEKRGRPGKDRRTTFKIEIPRRKEGA